MRGNKKSKVAFDPSVGSRPVVELPEDLHDLEDVFYWLGQMNKASIVINNQEGLLADKYAKAFAKGLQQVLDDGNNGGDRPQTVVYFEPYLIKKVGPEVTRLHAGRSSQDMLTTAYMARMRQELLDIAGELSDVIANLLSMAKDNKDTVIPAYTNGVAAQPNSFAHFLHGYTEAFQRDIERLQQFYKRLNLSVMGSTVLNGTGWPLNRDRMADYLGFDGIFYNCFDATQIYNLELSAEIAGVCTTIAIHMNSFIAEIMQQYAQPRPWIILQEGGRNTYVSSAMPQKRNPGILNGVRTRGSTILGEAAAAVFRAHNIPAGMADTRGGDLDQLCYLTESTLADFNNILNALCINPDRAYEELNLDWTASQEVADLLMRKYDIPFRIGHHVASEIVGYARKNDIRPLEFPYAEAKRIYAEVVAASGIPEAPREFPIDEEGFRAAIEPRAIVRRRAVKGGPQPEELEKMLKEADGKLENLNKWINESNEKITSAKQRLEAAFQEYLK